MKQPWEGALSTHLAIFGGRYDTFTALLDLDVPVDAEDDSGRNVLFYAAIKGNFPYFQKLVQLGLEPLTAKDNIGSNLLYHAVFYGKMEFVKKFVRRYGKQLTKATNNHEETLLYAALRGDHIYLFVYLTKVCKLDVHYRKPSTNDGILTLSLLQAIQGYFNRFVTIILSWISIYATISRRHRLI